MKEQRCGDCLWFKQSKQTADSLRLIGQRGSCQYFKRSARSCSPRRRAVKGEACLLSAKSN